jgi:hypothetical protein
MDVISAHPDAETRRCSGWDSTGHQVFQILLPEAPDALNDVSKPIIFIGPGSNSSERKVRRRQVTDDGNVEIHRARSEGAGRQKTGHPVSIELTLRATPLPGRQRGILAQ